MAGGGIVAYRAPGLDGRMLRGLREACVRSVYVFAELEGGGWALFIHPGDLALAREYVRRHLGIELEEFEIW